MATNNSLNNTVTNNNFTVPNGSITFGTNLFFTLNSVFIASAQRVISFGGATGNITFGAGAGNPPNVGTFNIAIGNSALSSATSGNDNVTVGVNGLTALFPGGDRNTGIGRNNLGQLATGSDNVAVGYNAGRNFTGAESNNIDIGNQGTLGDNAVIRMGTGGTHTSTFIAGIDGVNVGSVAKVLTMASNQIGTATITAGTGITVTPGANTITIAGSGTTNLTYTNVNTTPYVVLSTDEYLSVDCSGGTITVQLPNAATSGRVFIIKDRTGSANSNTITVTTVGGAVNIDGATSYLMNTQYAAIQLMGNGSTYEIF